MREIKFRGKPLYQRENEQIMVYGQFEFDAWHKPRIINSEGAFEIEPETLGQYTGLKDKNDKEIYEGDLLKHELWGISGIIWEHGMFRGQNKDHDITLADHQLNRSRVIGNIYENPDLLETMNKTS